MLFGRCRRSVRACRLGIAYSERPGPIQGPAAVVFANSKLVGVLLKVLPYVVPELGLSRFNMFARVVVCSGCAGSYGLFQPQVINRS